MGTSGILSFLHVFILKLPILSPSLSHFAVLPFCHHYTINPVEHGCSYLTSLWCDVLQVLLTYWSYWINIKSLIPSIGSTLYATSTRQKRYGNIAPNLPICKLVMLVCYLFYALSWERWEVISWCLSRVAFMKLLIFSGNQNECILGLIMAPHTQSHDILARYPFDSLNSFRPINLAMDGHFFVPWQNI